VFAGWRRIFARKAGARAGERNQARYERAKERKNDNRLVHF
jgi:hypothetical protein